MIKFLDKNLKTIIDFEGNQELEDIAFLLEKHIEGHDDLFKKE